jgi:hypothetical protein
MSVLDLSVYYPLPLLTTEGYVSLTNTMLDVAPTAPPAHVQLAADLLIKVLSEVEIGLVSRIDEDLSTRLDRAFDIFVDGVWLEMRERLLFFAYYKHEGTAKFTEEDRIALDFETRVDHARAADMILNRLFSEGTDFLRERFPQQATHMAARLDWVESKQLEDQLAELVTPEFVTLLKVSQNRYEAMVNERSSRDGKSVADLQALRHKLRVQLYAYAGAIGSMYDGTPEAAKVVETALRPILVVRAQARRKAAGLALEEDDLEVVGEAGEGELAGEDELSSETEGDAEEA